MVSFFKKLKQYHKTKLAILLVILTLLLGIYLRLRPLHGKYPIGWDAGNYQSFAFAFTKTWPLIPETLPIAGGVQTSSQILPLLPWLMAAFHVLSDLDLFTVTQFTPIIIFVFTSIVVFFLAREIDGNLYVGLLASFFYSTAPLELAYAYPAYLTRTLLANLFITSFFLFAIRASKSGKLFNRTFWKNSILGGLSLSALVASHDFSIFPLLIVFLSASILVFLMLRKKSLSFLTSFFISSLLGVLISVPSLVYLRDFYINRILYAVYTQEPGKIEAHAIRVMSTFTPLTYGILMSAFAIVGILYITLRKQNRSYADFLILIWALSMFLSANVYVFGIILFYPYRFLAYLVIPLSILASIGFHRIVTSSEIQKIWSKSWVGRISTLLLIISAFSVQIYEGAMAIDYASGAKVVLTPQIEEAMLWVKSNSSKNSIVFTSAFCPWALSNYIPAVSERTRLRTPPNVPAGWELEYERNLDAYHIVTLDDLELARNILAKYLTVFDEAYVFLSNQKKYINWAKSWGENIDLMKLRKCYDQVFENDEIVIFRAVQNFQEESDAIVLYDDELDFWSVTGGGTGNLRVTTSEGFAEKTKGNSSIAISVTTDGTYKWVGIKHDFAISQDWSNKDVLCFYFNGKNTTELVNIYIETSMYDRNVWRISDDFIGWRWIILPLNNPSASLGNGLYFDTVNTVRLAFYSQSTWYVDRVTVDKW